MNKIVISLSFMFLTSLAYGADQSCYVDSENCIDSSPSKIFDGETFTLSQLGISCWKYRPHYNCPLVDTCQQYIAQ